MGGGGGTVWNTLKEGGTEKRGGATKILKRGGGKLGQGMGALKSRGLEPPYELWNGSSNICGRQSLKNLDWYGLLKQFAIWIKFAVKPNFVNIQILNL